MWEWGGDLPQSVCGIHRRFVVGALPQAKAPVEGIHQYLAAMGGGLVGIGQLEIPFAFSLGVSRHGMKGDIKLSLFSPKSAFLRGWLRFGGNTGAS